MLDGPLKVMSKACHHITLYSLDSSQACAARRVVFGGFRATFVCRGVMVGGVCAVPDLLTPVPSALRSFAPRAAGEDTDYQGGRKVRKTPAMAVASLQRQRRRQQQHESTVV